MRTLTKQRLVVAAMALGIAGAALANEDANSCRPEVLDGLYAFSATGYNIVGGVAQPKAITEFILFNGDGTISGPGATVSINGTIVRSPAGGTGTYTLSGDCIGSLTFGSGQSFDMFVSPKGEDLWMIQTNPNSVLQGNATRVAR
ncbi:MAG TPA: hypothetical protein VN650_16785 [Gemmatimonadaceae bacterium]|nr:hypothetical protein [Gemmatimonadaceae bacterium]